MTFAQALGRDGFVLVDDLVSDAALEAIARDIAAVLTRRAAALGLDVPSGSTRGDITAQLVALFRHDPKTYMAAAKVCQHLIRVHQLGLSDEILSVVAGLGLNAPVVATRPVIHFMADALRIQGGYHKTPAHQDWRSVQGSLDGITIWLPLFDVGASDYALEIVPGSHLEGLRRSEEDPFGHRVAEDAIDDAAFVAVPIRRRSVLFFSGFLVHRTGAAGGTLARVALSYRYGNAAEPTFVDRNYPDKYVYRADLALLDPSFPSQIQLAGVYPLARTVSGETRS